MKQIERSLTSIEVAEMVGKDHKNILRDIRGYMDELGQLKVEQSKFFTNGSYLSEQNKSLPCYMVTRLGCEFIGHKLIGIKGTDFTARYIIKFHEMEDQFSEMIPKTYKDALLQLIRNIEENDHLQLEVSTMKPKAEFSMQ